MIATATATAIAIGTAHADPCLGIGETRLPLVARWSMRRAGAADFCPVVDIDGRLMPGPLDRQAIDPVDVAAGDAWAEIDQPATAAEALRRLGRWSLDAPMLRFDAWDWWFRARFDAAPARAHRLEFSGLAGLCEAWLNGTPLLATTNMHLRHRCDVQARLRPDRNELLLRFASLDRQLAVRRPRPRWRAPMVESQQLRFVRTTLLGRTPGWSPPAAAVGPWKGIAWIAPGRLEAHELVMRCTVEGDDGVLRVSARLVDADADADGRALDTPVELSLSRAGETRRAPFMTRDGRHVAELRWPHPALWWPHTHGEPALHDACIVAARIDGGEPTTLDLGRIGFRTIEADTGDDGFALRVNGTPVACRGACWMPLDVVSLASTPEACRAAVAQARDAGLNMLRIAGTTVYEEPHFHAACDALGVLVWQDFMFANMDYPADDAAFTASVRAEAAQHLMQWRAHPSLAVLCGNSEAEQQAAMWGAPRDAWTQPLFDRDLAELCASARPDVPYWPSSAHGGAFPHQNDTGTTSYYGVGAYLRPLADARESGVRFATECLAFAQVPAPSTLLRWPAGAAARAHHPAWKARVPRDLGAGWDFEDVRDHYVRALYGVDPVALRSVDHERYLALGRAVGAEVMQATFAEWRRHDSRCRGALVWYLRDLWPGAGFGLVDDAGKPKAAYHGVRNALAPVAVSIGDEGMNGLALHVANDRAYAVTATLEIALYRDDGLRVDVAERPVQVAPRSTARWPAAAWFDRFVDLSRAYRFGPSEYAVVVARLRGPEVDGVAPAFFFPDGRPSVQRRDVTLTVAPAARDGIGDIDGIDDVDAGVAVLEIGCDRLATSVHFDTPGWVADDEYFHIAPGSSRRVRFARDAGHPVATLRGHAHALNAWTIASIGAPR